MQPTSILYTIYSFSVAPSQLTGNTAFHPFTDADRYVTVQNSGYNLNRHESIVVYKHINIIKIV